MGRSKAALPFGPETMLGRVARLLGGVAGPIVVVAAPGQKVPALPGSIEVVRDEVSDRGPLQGLAAGLAALPDEVELAYATATDVPFLEPNWVAYLVELIEERDLVVPEVGGYLHPLAALYRKKTVLPAVQRLLAEDRLRPVFLLEALEAVRVDAERMSRIDPMLGTLRNLNTPEDYHRALLDAGFGSDA
jgi:molybdopterin-guanine dinucleotide biosynthesis protein A